MSRVGTSTAGTYVECVCEDLYLFLSGSRICFVASGKLQAKTRFRKLRSFCHFELWIACCTALSPGGRRQHLWFHEEFLVKFRFTILYTYSKTFAYLQVVGYLLIRSFVRLLELGDNGGLRKLMYTLGYVTINFFHFT